MTPSSLTVNVISSCYPVSSFNIARTHFLLITLDPIHIMKSYVQTNAQVQPYTYLQYAESRYPIITLRRRDGSINTAI
jgi:hypothetical protein